jgi:tripartite-type tricarboxylate transporter receptor subunit TctC
MSMVGGSMLRTAVIAAAILAGPVIVMPAAAELLSSRPITVIIPFTPGGSSDTLQRIVNKKVSDLTGQVMVVESRPGGGGAIGASAVKQALPDGHTLFQANSGTHAANVALYSTLAYDPIKDFRPITLMWSFGNLLAVPADSPAHSVADLIKLAAARPGGLNFASQGTGSNGHLLGEMLRMRTGAKMVHVPYRGAGPAALDLAAGRVDLFFVSYSSLLPVLQAGRVRVIAVTSAQRMPLLPDVPTMEEAGFGGIGLDPWFGLMAPAATPDGVITRLNRAFVDAIRDPQVVHQMAEQGADPIASTAAEFATFMTAQIQQYAKVVKSVGVQLQ